MPRGLVAVSSLPLDYNAVLAHVGLIFGNRDYSKAYFDAGALPVLAIFAGCVSSKQGRF